LKRYRVAILALALSASQAPAAVPDLVPYRPLYPALYASAAFETDAGDESFDAAGQRRDTALPNLQGRGELPGDALDFRLGWTFPLFEQDALPFFSQRLHTARVNLHYADLESKGALGEFIDTRSGLQRAGGGTGDVTLEFGSWLSGSARWREGVTGPLSTLLLVGLNLPVGVYDREAPANAGSNHLSAHLKLGAHGSPWRGAFLDGGLGMRIHGRNEEPAFGALTPAERGDELLWDLHLAQRLRTGWYLVAGASGSEGEANTYRDPRFTTQPTAAAPGSDVAPVAGRYRDAGTDTRLARLGLHWFATQRLIAALHWTHPFDGQSGEFDLPLQQRSPAACTPGVLGCLTSSAGSVRQDGFGSARSLASDRIGLTLTWQFGQGDTFSCAGCRD
jgi:hypothetical protein